MSVAFLGHMGLKQETAFGVEATPDVFGEILSEGISMDNNLIIPELISGTRFTKRVLPGPVTASGNITLPIFPEDLTPWIFKGVLGAVTTANNGGGVYTHTFSPAQTSTLPSFTIQIDAEAHSTNWIGCNFSNMSISAEPNGLVNLSVGIISQVPKEAVAATPSYTTLDPFTAYDIAVTLASAARADFEAFTIDITNDTEGVSTLNNLRYISKNVSKGFNCTGSFSFELGDPDIVRYLWGSAVATEPLMSLTPIDLTITMTSQANIGVSVTPYRCVVTIPNVYLATAPYNLSGAKSRVMQECSFVTRYDPNTAKQMDITLRNGQSGYPNP